MRSKKRQKATEETQNVTVTAKGRGDEHNIKGRTPFTGELIVNYFHKTEQRGKLRTNQQIYGRLGRLLCRVTSQHRAKGI